MCCGKLRAKSGDSVVPSYFSVLFVNEHCSICIPCLYQTNHSCPLLSLSLFLYLISFESIQIIETVSVLVEISK